MRKSTTYFSLLQEKTKLQYHVTRDSKIHMSVCLCCQGKCKEKGLVCRNAMFPLAKFQHLQMHLSLIFWYTAPTPIDGTLE